MLLVGAKQELHCGNSDCFDGTKQIKLAAERPRLGLECCPDTASNSTFLDVERINSVFVKESCEAGPA